MVDQCATSSSRFRSEVGRSVKFFSPFIYNLTQYLNSVAETLEQKIHLIQRIQNLDGKMDEQKEMSKLIINEHEEGKLPYLCKTFELFQGAYGENCFRAQWYYRCNEAVLHQEAQIFTGKISDYIISCVDRPFEIEV